MAEGQGISPGHEVQKTRSDTDLSPKSFQLMIWINSGCMASKSFHRRAYSASSEATAVQGLSSTLLRQRVTTHRASSCSSPRAARSHTCSRRVSTRADGDAVNRLTL